MKPGLAWLMKKWLNKTIQAGGEGGHDPREDAMSCIELVKRKMIENPGWAEFGKGVEGFFERLARIRRIPLSTAVKSNGIPEGSKEPQQNDFSDGQSATAVEEGRLRTAIVDRGNPNAWHKATTTIGCKTDEEVLEGLLKALPEHDFVFGRFMDVAHESKCEL